jgi:hypothetical protein
LIPKIGKFLKNNARARVCVDPRPAFKWLLTQPQRASLREGFAFRSGRLTPAAAQRQLTGSGQLFLCF